MDGGSAQRIGSSAYLQKPHSGQLGLVAQPKPAVAAGRAALPYLQSVVAPERQALGSGSSSTSMSSVGQRVQ